MEVCFERLRRSYGSALLDGRSIALENSYIKGTGECFSELVFYMEKHFPTSLVKDMAPVNNLAMDVHWFHKDLRRKSDKIALSGEFRKLEEARGGVVNRLRSERKRQELLVDRARKVLVSAWGLALILLLFGRLTKRDTKRDMGRKESEAGTAEPLPKEHERADTVLKKTTLVDIVSMALDSLADKIFVRGIRVEPDIREDVRIYGEGKSLVRALEVLFQRIVDFSEEDGRLGVFLESHGERMVLVVTPAEEGFLQEREGRMFSALLGEAGGRVDSVSSGQIRVSFVGVSGDFADRPKARLLKGKKRDVLRQLQSVGGNNR